MGTEANKGKAQKGKAPQAYIDGKIEPYKLQNRSIEDRKRISQMGVQARKEKKEQRMALQRCMKDLLRMKLTSHKQREYLRSIGFKDEDLINQTLLMVSLFKKGTLGDVGAIKEIVNMMDRLDILKDTGKVTEGVTINLITAEDVQRITENETEGDLLEEETDILSNEELEELESWEDDIYKG